MAGLSDTGFEVKTLEDLDTELDADLKTAFGESLDTSASEPFGMLKAIWAERSAELWDLAQALYSSADPDASTGAALSALSALTGTLREGAVSSTVQAVCTGTNGTVLPAGRQASVAGTGVKFETLAEVTLSTSAAWASSTPYALGVLRRNGATQRIYVCITAGTSAGSGGPTTTSTDITDGTVHWRYVGEGGAYALVDMESVETGPKIAAAYTLTTIETAVGGWSGVNNLLDAALGTDEESDADLRARRRDELRASGLSALDAIRANILLLEGVTACTVFENTSLVTDGDGLPGKAIEVLVQGGEDQAIWDEILRVKPAGIETYGSEAGTATDAGGDSHNVNFSRPTEVDIYVTMELIIDPDEYPEDGDTQVEEAIMTYGQTVKAGKNVVASKLEALAHGIPGVLEAVAKIRTVPTPVASTTIAIGRREIAVYDTSRITVTTTEGEP